VYPLLAMKFLVTIFAVILNVIVANGQTNTLRIWSQANFKGGSTELEANVGTCWVSRVSEVDAPTCTKF
jgi:hypothetical protein